jgi:hypothetical protein
MSILLAHIQNGIYWRGVLPRYEKELDVLR